MRKQTGRRFPFLAVPVLVLSVQASAHMIPADADNPALDFLRDNKQDEVADGVAQYCAHALLPVEECVANLKQYPDGFKSAAACAQEIKGGEIALDPTVAHEVPTNPGTSQQKTYWHSDYRDGASMGVHRHEWTAGSRDKAGTIYASWKVEALKRDYDGYSSTKSAGLEGHGEYKAGAKVEVPGVGGASSDGGVGVKGSASETETQKGPSIEEIRKARDEGYAEGYAHPYLTEVGPDVLCEQGKGCSSPVGHFEDPEDTTTKPADQACSCKCPGDPTPDDILEPPVSKNPEPPQKPGWLKTTDGGNGDVMSPMEEYLNRKVADSVQAAYELAQADEKKESLRKEAEEALKLGYCMEEWYGAAYCQKFNQKKAMVIDTVTTPDLVDTEASTKDPMMWTTVEPNPEANPAPALSKDNDADGDPFAICSDPSTPWVAKMEAGCPGF